MEKDFYTRITHEDDGSGKITLYNESNEALGCYKFDSFATFEGEFLPGAIFPFFNGSININEPVVITNSKSALSQSSNVLTLLNEDSEFITTLYDVLSKCVRIIAIIDNERLLREVGTRLKNVYIMDYTKGIEVPFDVEEVLKVNEIDYSGEDMVRLSYGRQDLDEVMNGACEGALNIIVGSSGSGKSRFTEQLVASYVTRGNKAFIYSSELTPRRVTTSIMGMLVGGNGVTQTMDRFTKVVTGVIKEDFLAIAQNYLKDKLFVFDSTRDHTRNIVDVMQEVYSKYGVKHYTVDNIMSSPIDAWYGSSYDKNEQQKKFVLDLKQFAKRNSCVVNLVTHVRKMPGAVKNDSIDSYSKDDLSGSSDISNLADLIVLLARAKDGDVALYYEDPANVGKSFSVLAKIVKDRAFGRDNKKFYWQYSSSTARFLIPDADSKVMDRQFRENLIPLGG